MTMKISFCIPVYNASTYLRECLDNIIKQCDENIEICIVDGGSTDNTPDIIREYQDKYPNLITSHFRTQRCGVDKDIFKALEMASGDYCWVFSGDDVIAKNAIAIVRDNLSKDIDFLMGAWDTCNVDMVSLYTRPAVDIAPRGTLDLHIDEQREKYLSQATLPHHIWSFCSSIIVRRTWFLSVPNPDRFFGTCYALSGQLFEHSKTQLRLKWIDDILLHQRGDNDSFLQNGVLRRIAIDLDGFETVIALTYGPRSSEKRHVQRILRNQIGLNWLMKAQQESWESSEMRAEYKRLVNLLYQGGERTDAIKKMYALHMPYPLHRFIYSIYQVLKKNKIVARAQPLGRLTPPSSNG